MDPISRKVLSAVLAAVVAIAGAFGVRMSRGHRQKGVTRNEQTQVEEAGGMPATENPPEVPGGSSSEGGSGSGSSEGDCFPSTSPDSQEPVGRPGT